MTDKTQEEQQLIPITDISQLMGILMGWHQNVLAQMRHFKKIPDGTKVTVNNEEKVITGDLLEGFILGLSVSISITDSLPFVPEVAEASEAPQEAVNEPVVEGQQVNGTEVLTPATESVDNGSVH